MNRICARIYLFSAKDGSFMERKREAGQRVEKRWMMMGIFKQMDVLEKLRPHTNWPNYRS